MEGEGVRRGRAKERGADGEGYEAGEEEELGPLGDGMAHALPPRAAVTPMRGVACRRGAGFRGDVATGEGTGKPSRMASLSQAWG
ncbi:MAG: hypothetical protein V8Q84_12105 [Bilophila sp.]